VLLPPDLLFFLRRFSFDGGSCALHINRARARAREAIKPYLFSLWVMGITAKVTAIHSTKRRQESEEMSHEAHLRKTGGRRSRRNEADAPNPAPLISPRFEHDDEDDLVADLGVSFSVERYAPPCPP